MRKYFFISLLITILSNTLLGQNCNCESTFNWLKTTFEENDAGFSYVIKNKGQQAYDIQNSEIYDRIHLAKSHEECALIMNKWLSFFRKGHIGIKYLSQKKNSIAPPSKQNEKTEEYRDWETATIDLDDFDNYLTSLKGDDLEGIWQMNDYVIGIKKLANEYVGFIVNSNFDDWKIKEIKLRIALDEKSAIFYMRDKSAIEINNIQKIGKKYLKLESFLFKRVSPKFDTEQSIEMFSKLIECKQPFIESLNDSTLYLRIPSFNLSEKILIDSVIALEFIPINYLI